MKVRADGRIYGASLAERFWAHVNKNGPIPEHCPELGPCWTWQGVRNHKGYGQIDVDGKVRKAHRVAWQMERGQIDAGYLVCHHCDNPGCVRVDHLWCGTARENALDCIAKGRKRTVVPRGENNHFARLTWSEVYSIREMAAAKIATAELAARFRVAQTTISRILRGKTWRTD